MATKWQEQADSEGAGQTEKIPNGVHDLTIVKVVFGKKDGKAFKSKSEDPQIMLVFNDPQDREAAQMVTLSRKAEFILAKFLGAAGANLAKMELDGVDVKDFAVPAFANANLIGRKLRAEVKWVDGYSEITPIRRDPTAEPAPPLDADDLDPANIPI